MKISSITLSKIIVATGLFLTCASGAYAEDCSSIMSQIDQKYTALKGKQTGGFQDAASSSSSGGGSSSGGTQDQDKTELKTLFAQSNRMGCPVDPKWVPRVVKTNSGQEIQSQFTPASQGSQEAPPDNTFQKLLNLPFDPLTSIKLTPSKPIGAPDYFKPSSSSSGGNNTTAAPKKCGEIASDFVSSAWELSKQHKVTFKDGCSGTDSGNVPRASPDKPSTVCTGTEFGNFGLIHSAYHNKKQLINVTDLYTKSPSQASAQNIETVAFNNVQTGNKKELNGCRLSTMKGNRNCGKLGDIIMLKTKPSEPDNKAYDKFLILGAGYDFYEAQDSQTEPIRRGSLKSEYNSMTYEVRRLSCNNNSGTTSSSSSSGGTSSSTSSGGTGASSSSGVSSSGASGSSTSSGGTSSSTSSGGTSSSTSSGGTRTSSGSSSSGASSSGASGGSSSSVSTSSSGAGSSSSGAK